MKTKNFAYSTPNVISKRSAKNELSPENSVISEAELKYVLRRAVKTTSVPADLEANILSFLKEQAKI